MKRRESPHVSDIVVLTAQQARVLGLWTQGHTGAEIAAEIGVSGPTVRSHLRRVVRKLGQNSASWRGKAKAGEAPTILTGPTLRR